MNIHWPEPTRRELAIAAAAGAVWALLGVSLAARGENQMYSGSLPLEGRAGEGGEAGNSFLTPPPTPPRQGEGSGANVRIYNSLPNGSTNIGSGTLIDVTPDGRRGLILSCGHLFTEGTGRVVVEFQSGRTHGASVLAVDRRADLSALEIANPPSAPAAVSFDLDAATALTACGFGPSGQFRAINGRMVGAAQGDGQTSLRMSGAVRSGDSGGGVFDASGRLVAVVWGESGGETYASTGAPLRSFLERLTGRASLPAVAAAACPDGRCPLVRPVTPSLPPAGQWPAPGGILAGETPPRERPCDCDDKLGAIAARLDALENYKQDRGDYLVRGQLDGYARADALALFDKQNRDRHETLLGRIEALGPLVGAAGRVAIPAATTALGISGPLGWAILAAASVGSGLLGRWMRRRGEARASSSETRRKPSASLAPGSSRLAPSQEATVSGADGFRQPGGAVQIDAQQPVERDDREARELLRLSQLEGRDPLQDALAGRLALDRLDALAESDADPHRARLADDLRRELRERFNEIAPTKFEVTLPQSS